MDLEAVVQHRLKTASLRVPPAPVVALRLQQLLNDEAATVTGLSSIVKQDQALAAVVLRLANSAAYRRTSDIVSLSAAVVVLGRKALADLAFAHAMFEQTLKSGSLVPLRRRAWRESLVAAQVASWVAELFGLDPDEAFVAGLLHDIGRVPVIGLLEEVLVEHPSADTRTEEGWWSLIDQFHVELGLVLAQRWGLPSAIGEVIGGHHEPTASGPMLEVVRVADDVVRLLDGAPSVGAERLGTIAALSTDHCRALAAKLPRLPAYLDAFREPSVSGVAEVVDYELRLVDELGVEQRVSLHVGGLVIDALVHALDSQLLAVACELRPGQLVRVRTRDLSFHAKVVGTAAGRSELAPWALDATQQAAWCTFVEQLGARFAA